MGRECKGKVEAAIQGVITSMKERRSLEKVIWKPSAIIASYNNYIYKII